MRVNFCSFVCVRVRVGLNVRLLMPSLPPLRRRVQDRASQVRQERGVQELQAPPQVLLQERLGRKRPRMRRYVAAAADERQCFESVVQYL